MSRRPLPTRTLGRVLDDDAGPDQLVADRVRRGEVPTRAGGLPLLQPGLDPGGELLVDAGRGAGKAEDAEDVVEAVEGVARGLEIRRKHRRGPIEGGVRLADEVEDRGQRPRHVEVVVERVLEGTEPRSRDLLQSGPGRALGWGGRLEPVVEVRQGRNRGWGVPEAVEGEVGPLPVWPGK